MKNKNSHSHKNIALTVDASLVDPVVFSFPRPAASSSLKAAEHHLCPPFL